MSDITAADAAMDEWMRAQVRNPKPNRKITLSAPLATQNEVVRRATFGPEAGQ